MNPQKNFINYWNKLKNKFPFPWNKEKENERFEKEVYDALHHFNQLRPKSVFENSEYWRFFLGPERKIDYSNCNEVKFPEEGQTLTEVVDQLLTLLQGMPIWTHPCAMNNVNPSVTSASLIAGLLTNIVSPNYAAGEYATNTARAELETIAMLASLMKWNPAAAGGVFTFGGTGCCLYAMKLALTRICGNKSRSEGIDQRSVILASKVAHYSIKTCANWIGLGTNQLIEIDIDDQASLSLRHFEQVLKKCKSENRPIALVIATMGTTDFNAFDPILEMRQLLDQYENSNGAPSPWLYADSVIGWIWLTFSQYDFGTNPMGIPTDILDFIYHNLKKIQPIEVADAAGFDFHKSGFTPAISSLFIVKDKNQLTTFLGKEKPSYISTQTDFNPFLFSLETSRSGAGAMAAWASIKSLGIKGFQVLLANILYSKKTLQLILEKNKNLVCINHNNHGYPTLFRVYPSHVDAKAQFIHEFNNEEYQEALYVFNILQKLIDNKLVQLRTSDLKIQGWESPPLLSISSGSRPPKYGENDREYWIFALKSYPVSPFTNPLSMLMVKNYILKARDLVIEDLYNASLGKSPIDKEIAEFSEEKIKFLLNYFLPSQNPLIISIGYELNDKENKSEEQISIESAFKSSPYFYHLSSADIYEIIHLSEYKEYAKNEFIFHEDENAEYVYILISGTVAAYHTDKITNITYLLNTLKPGMSFGQMALFEKGHRSASIQAKTDSKVMLVKNTDLSHYLM